MRKHILVAGVGRCGTSFLVCLLRSLGLDPGVSSPGEVPVHSGAGTEWDHLGEPSRAPVVWKNPRLCMSLRTLIGRHGTGWVGHVLWCMRSLEDVERSRGRQGYGFTDDGASGDGERQQVLWDTLERYQLPYTVLEHPRLVLDPAYGWDKLRGILPGVDEGRFRVEFDRLSDPSKVWECGDARHEPPGRPG